MTVQAALAQKLTKGKVRERWVFEVADALLDDGVLAVVPHRRSGKLPPHAMHQG